MEANRLSAEYINKVVEFLQFGKRNLLNNNGFFYCLCVCCANSKKHGKEEIFE